MLWSLFNSFLLTELRSVLLSTNVLFFWVTALVAFKLQK